MKWRVGAEGAYKRFVPILSDAHLLMSNPTSEPPGAPPG